MDSGFKVHRLRAWHLELQALSLHTEVVDTARAILMGFLTFLNIEILTRWQLSPRTLCIRERLPSTPEIRKQHGLDTWYWAQTLGLHIPHHFRFP